MKTPNLQHLVPAYWQGWLDAWTYLQTVHAGNAPEHSVEAASPIDAGSDPQLAIFQNLADYDAALDGASPDGLRLNIGSGEIALRGFVNVDLIEFPNVLAADLQNRWPWEDNSVNYVRASHIIEHLRDKIFTMNELWRVLKPGGKARISVPTTDGPGAWQDPTHVSFWNRRSFCTSRRGHHTAPRMPSPMAFRPDFKLCASASIKLPMDPFSKSRLLQRSRSLYRSRRYGLP